MLFDPLAYNSSKLIWKIVWQNQYNVLLFNYKINEHWIAVVQFSCLCTTNTQIFLLLKNRADHESTLSTNYCFLLVLTLLLFCICFCCSNFCCKMMFFSFSAMYFSAKCKIKSQLFNISPPFRSLERATFHLA